MPRTTGKQPKPKTGGGLLESRFIFVFPEAGKARSLKLSCFLLVKSKWRLSWVKCACKSVKRLAVIPIKREAILVPRGRAPFKQIDCKAGTTAEGQNLFFSLNSNFRAVNFPLLSTGPEED